jgi:glycosyltransferase 2 family protein
MKKPLLLVLRIVFAAGGISYILLSLNWHDHVIVKEDDQERSCRVVDGAIHPAMTDVVLQIDDARVSFRADQLAGDNFSPRPGIVTMIQHAKTDYLIYGLLILSIAFPISAMRWGWLMKARGLEATAIKRFRLVMVGAFFNFCMPGTTGGDVAKAYYVAKRSDRRADAIMSVIFDRMTGLMGLVFLAGVAGLFMLHDEVARTITFYIWLLIAGVFLGSTIYFKSSWRQKTGMQLLIDKLPGRLVKKVDDAASAYGNHKGALLAAVMISVVNHIAIASAAALAGYALGMQGVAFGLMLVVIPIIMLAGVVPLTYQGLGVMEYVGTHMLLDPPSVQFNQIAGMLVIVRLYYVFYSMFGALFLLKGDIHLHPEVENEEPETSLKVPVNR